MSALTHRQAGSRVVRGVHGFESGAARLRAAFFPRRRAPGVGDKELDVAWQFRSDGGPRDGASALERGREEKWLIAKTAPKPLTDPYLTHVRDGQLIEDAVIRDAVGCAD